MEFKIKLLKWSAGLPVAMINSKTASKIGVHTNERILLKTISRKPLEVSTIIDIVEKIVKPGEIAVSSELKKHLGLRVGQKVEVDLISAPDSLNFIKKKLDGGRLSEKEIDSIIKDVVNNSLSDSEVALFVSANYNHGMNMEETKYLIKSIVKFGNSLNLKNKNMVDKHSIGGIPGNRTTPIIVSICSAAGLTFPKTSSRAITTSAGTADVIETIARVEFSMDEVKRIIHKTNACMVWGGSLGMVPADSKIIKVEKLLNIDPESQLLASIMAKKLAVGSKYILIDIPYGKTAKVTRKTALRLKKKFEYLGGYFKKEIKVVLTPANEPVGRGIGPALELTDVINILDPKKKGPRDLEQKALFLSAQLLEMGGKAEKEKGIILAEKILDSGKAFKKFKEIIKAQEGKVNGLRVAEYKRDILSKRTGEVIEIDNKKINLLARTSGCPTDKCAGLYLHAKTGDPLKKRDKILTIYAESPMRLKQAVTLYKKIRPIMIK